MTFWYNIYISIFPDPVNKVLLSEIIELFSSCEESYVMLSYFMLSYVMLCYVISVMRKDEYRKYNSGRQKKA